jgi:predicted kinase
MRSGAVTHPLLLIQMSGCPGAGKSTIARAIGRRTGAAVLDQDVIKSALLENGVPFDVAGKAAYETSHALARSLLGQGFSVILDSACFYQVLLDKGLDLAATMGAGYRYIECAIEDLEEIRRRLTTRTPLPSQCADLGPAPGDQTRRSHYASGEELFRDWIANMKRPPHSYLRIDTTRPLAVCLAEVIAFLEEG